METRKLGDVEVSAIGLGAMQLSRIGADGTLPDRDRAFATVYEALDRGVTFIDVADCYAPDNHPKDNGLGHNEELVADALRNRSGGSEGVFVATKGGIQRRGSEWPVNGRPEWIREAADGSLRRLGVESIDLYQSHRPDPAVPYAETIGAFKELYDAGKVRRVGLSNANPKMIREAHDILGDALVSVQNEFSPSFRSSEPELDLCEELGLAFLPWAPLGGMRHAADLGSEFAAFGELAGKYDATAQQVCLAWMLAKSPSIIPIPGASRPESAAASADAVHLKLEPDDLARLDG